MQEHLETGVSVWDVSGRLFWQDVLKAFQNGKTILKCCANIDQANPTSFFNFIIILSWMACILIDTTITLQAIRICEQNIFDWTSRYFGSVVL